MGLLPKSKIGIAGFWVTAGSGLLLAMKFANLMPLPTPLIFSLIFIGSILSIIALFKGDRSWLQFVLTLPVFLFALAWTLAEVIWPH